MGYFVTKLNEDSDSDLCIAVVAEDFDISVSGPGKADVVKKEDKGGVVHVVYMPMSPGEYEVKIKHKGKAIHGSPFSVKVSGNNRTIRAFIQFHSILVKSQYSLLYM